MPSKAHNLLVKYCQVYSMWLNALNKAPGCNLPTPKERTEWHQATKEIYDYTGIPYPEWIAKELRAIK